MKNKNKISNYNTRNTKNIFCYNSYHKEKKKINTDSLLENEMLRSVKRPHNLK